MTAVKVIKVLGTSTESWDDAVHEAISQASETVQGMQGVKVMERTATIEDGSVDEYKATVEIAFRVAEHQT